MSIATDEAKKKYPAPTDVDDPMYKYVEAIAGYPSAKRQGYVAGRTAEPTEAEIEAAAKAMYWHYASYETDGTVDYKEAMRRYDGMLWEGIVRDGWAAARKAVM